MGGMVASGVEIWDEVWRGVREVQTGGQGDVH